MTNKFTLSEKDQQTYKDIKIYHAYKNDKHADLPLLICCENGEKAIVVTSKNLMRCLAPNYFGESNRRFRKSRPNEPMSHEDGQIYSMRIPGLIDPKHVSDYIQICQSRRSIENKNLDDDDIIPDSLLTIDNCFEYFCISKALMNHAIAKQILDFINGRPSFELAAKAIYQYQHILSTPFEGFIKSFIKDRAEDFNTFTNQKKFCKYLNIENLDIYLSFIAIMGSVENSLKIPIPINLTFDALKYYLSQALIIGKDSWAGKKWIEVFEGFDYRLDHRDSIFARFTTQQQHDILNTILQHLTLDDRQRSYISDIIMNREDTESDDDLDKSTDGEDDKGEFKKGCLDGYSLDSVLINKNKQDTKSSEKATNIEPLYNSFSKPDEFQLSDNSDYFEIPFLGSPVSMVSNLNVDKFRIDYKKCRDLKPHKSESTSARTIRIGWTAGKNEIDWENYFFIEFDRYRIFNVESYGYHGCKINPVIDISYNIMTKKGRRSVSHRPENNDFGYTFDNRLDLDRDHNISFEFEKKKSEEGFIFKIFSAAFINLRCCNGMWSGGSFNKYIDGPEEEIWKWKLSDGSFDLAIDGPKEEISKWRMLIDCIEENVDDLKMKCECCRNLVVGGRYSAKVGL